jgi:hypothetical protein
MLFGTADKEMLFGEYDGRSAANNWGLGPVGGGSPESADWEPPPGW